MKFFSNSLLVLVPLSLVYTLCFGLKCYTCTDREVNTTKCMPGSDETEIQECSTGHLDQNKYCVIEQDLNGKTVHLGCVNVKLQPFGANTNSFCEHHTHEDLKGNSSNEIQLKNCYCNKDLCNVYNNKTLSCWVCSFDSFPYGYNCRTGEIPKKKKCLLNARWCAYQVKPRKMIGCVTNVRPHNPKTDIYFQEGNQACYKTEEHIACYCKGKDCNSEGSFVEPPSTNSKKFYSRSSEVTPFSVSIIFMLLLCLFSHVKFLPVNLI